MLLLNLYAYFLSDTIAELNKKVSQLQQEIQKVKNSSKQEVSLINLALDEKEQLIAIQRTERDSIESDKDRFHAVVTQQEKYVINQYFLHLTSKDCFS